MMEQHWFYVGEDGDQSAFYLAADVDALNAERDKAMTELRDSFNAVCNRRDEMAGRIEELERAYTANAKLSGEVIEDRNRRIAELEKALREAKRFLEDPRWGTYQYMEGSYVYEDKDEALETINSALMVK
jgi:hypothetical protein